MEALRAALARLCRPEALLEGESYYHNAAEERGGGDGSQLTTFGDHQLRHSNMQKRDAAFHALIDHASVLPFIEEYMGEPRLAGDWHIRKNIGPRSSWCEYSWHTPTHVSAPLTAPRAPVAGHRGHGPEGFVRDAAAGKIRTRHLNIAWMLDDQAAGEGCLVTRPLTL